MSPLITAPKINTNLLWDLTLLFLALALVYVVAIFFYRNKFSSKSIKVMQRKKELSPMVSEFIFHENDATKDEKSNYVQLKIEIRELIKNDFNRKVLSEVLLDLKKDVSGDSQERLCQLYQDLNLHLIALKKLNSWQWQVVSKAITDLTNMQVNEAYGLLTKFLNDRRTTIRRQAEIAVVSLNSEGINHFLDTTTYKISEWQQLKLLDVIRNQKDYTPPRFKAWLTSSNSYVVLFALRLIKFYHQNDANTSLIELVKHKNNQIKQEAIGCIKEFHVIDAIEVLKTVFWSSTTDIKINILDAIGSIGNEESIDFLNSIEKKESNFYVRSKAISSINSIKPGSIMPSEGIADTTEYQIPDDLPITETNANTEEAPNTNAFDSILDANRELHAKKVEPQEPIVGDKLVSLDFIPLVTNEIKKQPKSVTLDVVKELPVIFDIVTDKEKPLPKQISAQDLAFLPIVVESRAVEEPYKINQNNISIKTSINDIEVHYEAIENSIKKITKLEEIEVFSEEELAVIPVLEIIPYEFYASPEIQNIEVISTEIKVVKTPEQIIYDTIVNDPYFFTIDKNDSEENNTDIPSDALTESPPINEIMTPEQEIKFKKLINELVNFENQQELDEVLHEFETSPLLEFENEYIDISFIPVVETEVEQPNQPEKTTSKASIPKSKFSESLVETFVFTDENSEQANEELINDLKEMGDHRELPLLNEMLDNQKYKAVHTSIKQLIRQFSIEAIESLEFKKAKIEEAAPAKAFNVFEDLFKTCDAESKLILLDEIAAVGDADDIDFLQSLLTDKNIKIQNKAEEVLLELQARLETFEAIEASVPEARPMLKSDTTANANEGNDLESTNDIFKLNFEITPEDKKPTGNDFPNIENSAYKFFDQVYEFSSNIINKING